MASLATFLMIASIFLQTTDRVQMISGPGPRVRWTRLSLWALYIDNVYPQPEQACNRNPSLDIIFEFTADIDDVSLMVYFLARHTCISS